jgi:hypothetical protein
MNHKWGVHFNSAYIASIVAGIFCLINLGSREGKLLVSDCNQLEWIQRQGVFWGQAG